MSKFKVGDRIRVLRLHPYSTDITIGKTYPVKRVFDDGDIFITDDVGDLNRIASKNVEPVYSSNPAAEVDNLAAEYGAPKAWFKAGERVRYVGKSSEFVSGEHVGKTGKVTWISESGFVSVDFDDGTDQNGCYPANLEHVAAEPATATAATGIALRIEAGKFYKTRDGRKVGPMHRGCGHFIKAHGDGFVYREDGKRLYEDTPHEDIVAEWPTTMADIVRKHTSEGTAIVALIEDGQPKPASRPYVHADRASAATEAGRLANAHKGQEFGVYTLGEVRKVEKVYDFGWQNLAMSGRKIEAIKNLRADNGLTLKGAKDAVEHWVASQAA